jgi:hypothetical protein
MTDHEERALRHARDVAAMTDEEVRLELEAAGIDVEKARARFDAMRGASKREQRPTRKRIFLLAAAAALFVAILAVVFVTLNSEPAPIAPLPNREPTPLRVVERHQDLVSPHGDGGTPLNVPVLTPR